MKPENKPEKNNKDAVEIVQTDFSRYVPSIFSTQSLKEIMGDKTYLDVVLECYRFEETSFGDVVEIGFLCDGAKYKVHTSSKPMVQKLKIAMQNRINLPCTARILQKESEYGTYYDLI